MPSGTGSLEAVLGVVGVMNDQGDGDDDASAAPGYVIAAGEGIACVSLAPVPDVPRRVAVGWLAELAARLREKGLLGRLALLDGRTGALVAARGIWP